MTAPYVRGCKNGISKITKATGVSEDDAYAMMLMTAALMDLCPDDSKVTAIILKDCGCPEEAYA